MEKVAAERCGRIRAQQVRFSLAAPAEAGSSFHGSAVPGLEEFLLRGALGSAANSPPRLCGRRWPASRRLHLRHCRRHLLRVLTR